MSLVTVDRLSFELRGKVILNGVSFSVQPGAWLAVLGENGAGKTTLLDLIMGFKKPSAGRISVLSHEPIHDVAGDRQKISYLSEKVDLSGDWSIREFFDFNARFYSTYDRGVEAELCRTFRVVDSNRVGNLSAGEIRRAQIVAALSYRPLLIVIDEITAVLDIVGRRRLIKVLSELRQGGASIIFATNILEGLHGNITDLFLLNQGEAISRETTEAALGAPSKPDFST